MRYNLRGKTFPDGSVQFTYSSYIQDSVKRPKRFTGEHIERGKKGNIKSTVKEIYDIAKSNEWNWFVNLTFDPRKVDRFDFDSVSAEMKKFTDVMRKRGYKHLIVPELHKDGAYHFHGLIQGDLPCTEAISPYTGKVLLDKKGRVVYNVDIYKFGHTQATKIDDTKRAACYITKYVNKDLGEAVPKGKKRYWASKSLNRPDISYDLIREEEFGCIYRSARYTKEIYTQHGNYVIAEF